MENFRRSWQKTGNVLAIDTIFNEKEMKSEKRTDCFSCINSVPVPYALIG